MGSEHRKIELQSPADLTYLTTQLRRAARQKLNLHLPPVPPDSTNGAQPDELRRNVEDLVDAFVAQVLQGMRLNISINGLDVVSSGAGENKGMEEGDEESVVEKEEFEAFDDKLRGQLGAAVARRDALVAKISAHRRTTPGAAAAAFEHRFEQESAEAARRYEEVEMRVRELGDGVDVAEVKGLKRQEEVERNWERAVEGLQRLNKGLPETRARLERAGDVVGYLGQQQQQQQQQQGQGKR